MSFRIIVRGLGIDRIPLRRYPTSISVPVPVPKPPSPPCPCQMPPELKIDNRPPFCRYVRCKHPNICKNFEICYVDWEPDFVKE